MSLVRFATICDRCGKRSEEYTCFKSCTECADDICPDCTTDVSYGNDPDKLGTICDVCMGYPMPEENEENQL